LESQAELPVASDVAKVSPARSAKPSSTDARQLGGGAGSSSSLARHPRHAGGRTQATNGGAQFGENLRVRYRTVQDAVAEAGITTKIRAMMGLAVCIKRRFEAYDDSATLSCPSLCVARSSMSNLERRWKGDH